MNNGGMSPFKNPFQWLFQVSLLVLGTALALTVAVDLLRSILPWIIAAFGIAGITWGAVEIVRWRRSRW